MKRPVATPGPALTAFLFLAVLGIPCGCGADAGERLDRARRLFEEGRPRAARELAEGLAREVPREEGARVRLADLLRKLLLPQRAVEVLREGEPRLSPEGRACLAEAWFHAGKRALARREIEALAREGPLGARALRVRAKLAMSSRDWGEARKVLEELLRGSPGDAEARALFASVLWKQGKLEEAEAFLRRAPAEVREAPEVREILAAVIHARRGKERTALREMVDLLEPVAAKRPLNDRARSNLFVALLHLGKGAEAERVAAELTRDWPEVAEYWSDLGLARRQRGKYEEAVEAFRRAAALAPRDKEILKNLGRAYLEAIRIEEQRAPSALRARAAFEKAREIDPRDPEVWVGLARSLVKADPASDENAVRAKGEYERALALDPGNFAANLNLALLYYDVWPSADAREKALALFDRAAQAVPPSQWEEGARRAYEELRRGAGGGKR